MGGEPEDIGDVLLRWLGRHWTQSKLCPICGQNTWTATTTTANLPASTPGTVVQGAMPLGVVICNTCGYTRFFSQSLIEFNERREREEEDERQ
jgi:C4-type Zn-finger protein